MTANDNMLSFTVELGATIPTTEYGNLRPLIKIANIDPSGDVEAQINIAMAGATQAFTAIDDQIVQFVEEAAKAIGGGLKINNRLKAVEEALAATKRDATAKSR